jgi:hypothetical protein
MADTNDPQPAYRITYLLAATKVAKNGHQIPFLDRKRIKS